MPFLPRQRGATCHLPLLWNCSRTRGCRCCCCTASSISNCSTVGSLTGRSRFCNDKPSSLPTFGPLQLPLPTDLLTHAYERMCPCIYVYATCSSALTGSSRDPLMDHLKRPPLKVCPPLPHSMSIRLCCLLVLNGRIPCVKQTLSSCCPQQLVNC